MLSSLTPVCPVGPPIPLLQITCLGVYKWNGDNNEPACLGAGQDLTSFGYFQRSTVKEMLLFVSRTIVKRTQPGQRQSVEHNGAAPRVRGFLCVCAHPRVHTERPTAWLFAAPAPLAVC